MILSKKEFMQQYVLNRAIGNDGVLDGDVCAKEGENEYYYINKVCEETNNEIK